MDEWMDGVTVYDKNTLMDLNPSSSKYHNISAKLCIGESCKFLACTIDML